MQSLETAQRAAVVAEARSWLRTPYIHSGRIKGAGIDCAQLLVAVFANVGLIKIPEIADYPPDWHLNRATERYLAIVLAHSREISGPPLPGDVALWRFGRCFSHGAIVIDWPVIIHAYVDRACTLEDAHKAAWLRIGESNRPRPVRFFSYWGREPSAVG